MRVFASMDDHLPVERVAEHARRVEALGYDGLHVAETVHDAFLVSMLAVQATERLEVRTAVAVAFPRSPMTTALATWDLARLSAGRFSLGLGTQVRGNIEGRYATPWSDPVGRMREYVGSLRAIFDSFQNGTPLAFEGEHYRFTRLQPYFNPGPHDHPAIPLLLGGVGPAMCRLAGEVADGLVTHPTSAVPAVLERIRDDVRAGERVPGSTVVVASTQFVTGRDAAAVAAHREDKRQLLGFLYSTPAYRPALDALGLGDRADRLLAMSRAADWSGLADALDDEVLDAVAPSATHTELADVLLARYAGRADELVVTPPADPADDEAWGAVVATLRGYVP
jgi:probable F420-dependent oxidoreductase